jgi:putative ATP-binding cassette transporter
MLLMIIFLQCFSHELLGGNSEAWPVSFELYIPILLRTVKTDHHGDVLYGCGAGNILREVGPGLVLKELSIVTPNSHSVLYRDLNLQLAPGESLLVMGPSGCGKSSLLRAIAGLWNRGSGLLQSPPSTDTFFLPQKPYMPLGSLRDQLLFPKSSSNANASSTIGDSELYMALAEVALEALPARVGGLDAVKDWSDTLSAGEQQRLAFARLFLHCPKVAFLDEASSALDAGNEARN